MLIHPRHRVLSKAPALRRRRPRKVELASPARQITTARALNFVHLRAEATPRARPREDPLRETSPP
ncbi:hypothetical protein [Nonomuraea dietziae]|uniref:hypothetical protein n=1 Tax=Nonomuraea dietziae TaxID=65515 RepID=UPI0031DB0A28